ncbi:MAG TPA: hypothetical protein VKA49_20675, partial [Flavitalea sp.]|nr:hypothetical protein [Flavitalea sp.]
FSSDGEYALVFGSDTLSIIDSHGKNIKRIRLALLPEQNSYVFATGDIEEIALSPDWKKLLVKHGEEYVLYQSESVNDSIIHIGPDIVYRTDPNLRPQKLLGLPNAPDEAVFRNRDFIISMDTMGFVSQWELQKRFNDINEALVDIQHITATYAVKDKDSLLKFEDISASKNKDSLLNAADYYFKKARKGREVTENFTKAKTLYAKLVKLENSDFQRKLFTNSIVVVNDGLREFERSKAKRDYRILIEFLLENISIQESQLKLQPQSKKLRKQLSDYYWPLSYYQLFIKDYNESAIVSATKGLELYPANDVINTNLALGYLLTGQFSKADSIYRRFKNSFFYSSGQPQSFRDAFIEDFKKLETAGVISKDRPEIYNKEIYYREIYNKMRDIRREILKESEEDHEF